VALSMLTYLIPNYSSGTSGTDLVVADIGSQPLTLVEVQRVVQAAVRNKQMPPEILPNYIPQMVDQMVTERAMAYEAARLGFQVSDIDVRDAIQQMVPNLFPDGKFVGKDAYAGMLAQQNMTIAQFEEDLRRQILIAKLRDVAMEGTIVTPLEIEQAFRKKNEKIKIEFVKLTGDKYRNEVQPSAQDMQAYFKANSFQYQVPEKKQLAVLFADQAKLEQAVNPTDADLQRIYNQEQDQFRTKERVKVRHILLMTQGKPPADEPKIKAKAEDLLKQIRGGADFAKLVKEYSEDPGSKDKGGEYWVSRDGQMVPEFEKAAFTLKPGQTGDLVKTSYGYHIVQTMEHQDAGLRTFPEVKAEIAAQWKKQRVNDMMQQASDKAQAALAKDPLHPDKVAADFNMQVVRVDDYTPGQTIKELGASPDFDQSVAPLKKGEVSQPVALAGKIALAVVTEITPPRASTFEEVQTKVHDSVVQNRLAAAVQNHAKELLDKAKSMGGDLGKAAKSMGLEVKTSNEFDRSGNVEGVGTASYVQEGFSLPNGSVYGPITTPDGGTVVSRVIQHSPPDLSTLPAQRAVLRDEIKSQKARDRNQLFEAGVKDTLIKQGKVKIHKDVVDRLVGNFRTS
jgi:peptidyl-prolyl cis-trans isomerase D